MTLTNELQFKYKLNECCILPEPLPSWHGKLAHTVEDIKKLTFRIRTMIVLLFVPFLRLEIVCTIKNRFYNCNRF